MRTIFLFILFFLITFTMFAQDIKLRGATSQSWAGGVCCRSGINYVITLESADTTAELKVDTVWVGNTCYYNSDAATISVIRNVVGGKGEYNIQVSEVWDERVEPYSGSQVPKVKCPYSGEANIICHFKKKYPKHITVEKFTELDPIAYP